MFRILQVSTSEVLPLRSQILRRGEPCSFPEDSLGSTFHFGVTQNGQILSVATFLKESHAALPKALNPYRLRGMATDSEHQGQGLGGELLEFACQTLQNHQVDALWCNARLSALRFYQKHAFQPFGESFEIPEIGPHLVLFRTPL